MVPLWKKTAVFLFIHQKARAEYWENRPYSVNSLPKNQSSHPKPCSVHFRFDCYRSHQSRNSSSCILGGSGEEMVAQSIVNQDFDLIIPLPEFSCHIKFPGRHGFNSGRFPVHHYFSRGHHPAQTEYYFFGSSLFLCDMDGFTVPHSAGISFK